MKNMCIYLFMIIVIMLPSTFLVACSESIDDKDLRVPLSPPDIPKEQNAFYYFLDAANMEIDWDEEDELTEEFMTENSEMFSLLEQGLACTQCQYPALRYDEPIPVDVVGWIGVADVWLTKADYLFEIGQEEPAIDWALKIAQVGHTLEQCKGTLICYLVAISIKETALEKMQEMLPNTTLSADKLKSYADMLSEFIAPDEWFAYCYQVEYSNGVQAIDDLWNSIDWKNAFLLQLFNPNETKQWLYQSYTGEQIEFIHTSRSNMSILTSMWAADNTVSCGFMWFPPNLDNIIGRDLLVYVLPSTANFIGSNEREEAEVITTQLLTALRCYQVRSGTLPQSLEELVPTCISSLPEGLDFRYYRDKKELGVDWQIIDIEF